MGVCARLKLSASKSLPSAIPEPLTMQNYKIFLLFKLLNVKK